MNCTTCNNDPCKCGKMYENMALDDLIMLIVALQIIAIEKMIDRKIKSIKEI